MKKVKYIYTFFIVLLFGLFSFACSDDDIEQGGENESSEYSGEPIQTSFKVCVSAPDVSVDVDGVTRAGDNANIDYAMPENGGRFQNIVIVVTDNSATNKVYAIHCNKWYTGDPTSAGVKTYEYIFPDLKVATTQAKVFVLGNVSTDVYDVLSGITISTANVGKLILAHANYKGLSDLINTHNISVEEKNLYNISFKPKEGNFKVGDTEVTTNCTGMPVNAMATADVKKGSTVFNVHMKRVCARLQVTFRNYTGKTDYDDTYYGAGSKGNRVYVDNFVLKKALTTSTKYFYNGTAPSSPATVDFDILAALGGTNNHECNMIENGESKTVSLYVFESVGDQSKTVTVDKKTQVTTKYYTYDLKVDRGKSLGNRAGSLQDGNVYVMWNDNLDPGSKQNKVKQCLGSNGSNITLVQMDDAENIPYGNVNYGNRVFWHYKDKKIENCEVNLGTDLCTFTGKYIGTRSPGWAETGDKDYPTTLSNSSSAGVFSEATKPFGSENNKVERKRLYYDSGSIGKYYMQISNDKLKSRYFLNTELGQGETYYPWVFFAKYIIKNGETFSTGTGTSKTDIQQIERNGSYELDFSVMPNYNTKQELLVNCVRKQSEITWSETQK